MALALLVILTALASPASAHAQELVDRVLAVVGGQVVTLSDARAAIEFGLVEPRRGFDETSEALQYLVNRQLMLAEVDRYSAPSPDQAVLTKRMAAIRSRYPNASAFEQALARTAFTQARLRDLVGDNLRIEGYLDQRFNAAAQPTSEEVERYYLDHRAEFTRNGAQLPLDEVRAQAQARVTAERRNFLIAEWLDRVRRRFAVTTLYTALPR